MGRRLRQVFPKRRVPASQISFTGMRDSLDMSTSDPRKAHLLQNVYPQDAEMGGGLRGRPGFSLLGTVPGLTPPAIRHVDTFTKNNGTRYTIAFAGAKMYTVDLTTGGMTDVTGTMTIDPAAEIYTVQFSDGVVVSDGVNKPWHWDGTTHTVLTNAPITYGQPVVYYAKLFLINAGNRVEVMWSEENQPNLGYAVGGYNNAWQLVQVSQTPIYALVATEQALYYFRDKSIGAVVGAVTPEFASTGVQEAVSDSIGTRSPGSVTVIGRDIFFLDNQNRPQHFAAGGGLTEGLWNDARQTIQKLSTSAQFRYRTVYWPWADLILFAVAGPGATALDRLLVFNIDRKEFVAVWTGYDFHAISLVEDADGDPMLLHGDLAGNLHLHGAPGGTVWSDGGAAIEHIVDGTAIDYDIKLEKKFLRLDLVVHQLADFTGATVQTRTPNGTRTIALPNISSGGAVWGEAIWGTDEWVAGEPERHLAVGLDDAGRWLRVRLEHDTLDEEFGFIGWTTEAVLVFDHPSAR